MFYSFTTIPSYSNSVGGNVLTSSNRQRNIKKAHTVFRDGDGSVIKVNYKYNGPRGNNWVACLLRITERKYRFRLYDSGGTRINTITQTDDVAPYDVIKELVASINDNVKFKKYLHVSFIKESTSAFSSSVNIGDGQRLTGGR
mgnify:CR=1 FL=1